MLLGPYPDTWEESFPTLLPLRYPNFLDLLHSVEGNPAQRPNFLEVGFVLSCHLAKGQRPPDSRKGNPALCGEKVLSLLLLLLCRQCNGSQSCFSPPRT